VLEEECTASVTAPEGAESSCSIYSPSGPLHMVLQPEAMALSASSQRSITWKGFSSPPPPLHAPQKDPLENVLSGGRVSEFSLGESLSWPRTAWLMKIKLLHPQHCGLLAGPMAMLQLSSCSPDNRGPHSLGLLICHLSPSSNTY